MFQQDSTEEWGAQTAEFTFELTQNASDDDFLEFRCIPLHGHVRQIWVPVKTIRGSGPPTDELTRLNRTHHIFVGVALRRRKGGERQDVSAARCLWADYDNGLPEPWPEAIPPPSMVVESSPGRFHYYWFLDEVSIDLDVVEHCNARIAVLTGGDSVGDRARVMRVPGFRNHKHSEKPVSILRECHLDRLYQLAELDRTLPPLPVDFGYEATTGSRKFDHASGWEKADPYLNSVISDRLLSLGLKPNHGGRLHGRCPFPDHPSQSNNFRYSLLSGRWWCFGGYHAGRHPAKLCVSGNAYELASALDITTPIVGRDGLGRTRVEVVI